jgi:deoxyribodipyrimidine photo-lyase
VSKFPSWWTPGEAAGRAKLDAYLSQVGNYKAERDFPNKKATSRLGAHFHFGEVSPYLAWSKVKKVEGQKREGVDCYLSEVGWREFSHYLLYYVPMLPEENYQKKFDDIRWVPDADGSLLQAWKDGKTGCPIVDAGMRELKSVGWMHNRLRMITASYLTKDLLIDWRKGEEHFWEYLVDADLASNSFGWQWVAGSGMDASPYFRVFNPFLQSEKFDKEGEYIKKWCPELKALTKKTVHNPSEVDSKILKIAGITLGKEYPKLLIDHSKARDRAMVEWRRINPKPE